MSTALRQGPASIVLGTYGLHGHECINAIIHGLELGQRCIDTAQSYGNEEEVGKAIELSCVPRDEIIVTTKISTSLRENPKTVEEAYDSAQKSLNRLRLSYIDVVLVHAPSHDMHARRATWLGLEKLAQEGMVKTIGVSNFGVRHLMEMDAYARLSPQIIQSELHPWCQQQELTTFCAARKIGIQAYCCLLRNRKANHRGLLSLASKYNKNTPQVLIRYSLQKGWTPVIKSRNIEHLRTNLDVFGFTIEDGDMLLMDSWDEDKLGAIIPDMIAQAQE